MTGLPELAMMVEDALVNAEEVYEEQLAFQKRSYRVRARVIRRNGDLLISLALQDVTELVRLNRARRDMVANISHELRTPIANIRLIIESLFHEQEKPKRKQSTTALKAVARETDSLLWLVQELLDLSMIESGQAILRMEETFAAEMVDEAIERVIDQSDAKEIEILNEVPREFRVLADRDQVRRVLINLIHNSIKWSPPGEKIKVRAERAGDEVVMSVLDWGPGVPEEFRERIFERFYQVDPSRSVGEGTGLGLAICRHIVEAHGGSIWVVDNVEQGRQRRLLRVHAAHCRRNLRRRMDGFARLVTPHKFGIVGADLHVCPFCFPDHSYPRSPHVEECVIINSIIEYATFGAG
ncbi:MAG: HAMP domain-containing sensor histidine kinase [Anaerolineae bacterium]